MEVIPILDNKIVVEHDKN